MLGERAGQAQAISSALNVTIFSAGAGVTTALRGYRQTEQEYFSQADLRLNRQVTINAGLRYSYFAVLSEVNGLLSNLYAVDAAGSVAPDKSPMHFGRFIINLAVETTATSDMLPDRGQAILPLSDALVRRTAVLDEDHAATWFQNTPDLRESIGRIRN